MNQYLEEEKKKITEQIAETKKAAEASLWQKAAERADNNLSKAEQAEKNRKLNEFFNDTFEKYNALLRMQELLNNDFKGVTKPLEYVELSARVGNELTEEDYYKLNPTYKHDKDLNDEKQKVEGLIGKIAKATAENPKATMAQAKDQKMVLESEKDNYDALLRMQEILNNDSVAYGDFKTLIESLEYDISLEKEKKYKDMSIVEVIKNITDFTSSIWQVHPFREGNTRTTAVFIEKYLISLGYNVDNSLFKDKSVYFRNALVRSNYFNNYLNIKEDSSFLIKFYENLLLGKNNNLHSRDLIVEELFDKEN